MALDGAAVIDQLEAEFPGAVRARGEFQGQSWVEIGADRSLEVFEWLRDEPKTAFDFLIDVTAVHFPDDTAPMELVYHLHSYPRNDRLRVKIRTGDTGPVASLADLWRSADWNEREVYDMFGIRFEGHPDLRRILMPDDYTDFPLRKELPLYRG